MSLDGHEWGDLRVSLGWSQSAGPIGRAINWADTVEWCGQIYHGRFSHVFWVFDFERGPSLIYESHVRGGVQVTPLEQLEDARKAGKVHYYYLHPLRLDQARCCRLWNACSKIHGSGYDVRHLFGLLLWLKAYGRDRLQRPRWLEWALNEVYICSELTEVTARAIELDLCGEVSTPATSTPESQFFTIVGLPSEVAYCPGRALRHPAAWALNTRTITA